MIGFILTIPNAGSWDGKWTGERNLHFTYKNNRKKEKELDGKKFRYDFGDGWTALIECKKIGSVDAKKLKKKSSGFCGYDWMVDSIIDNNKIINERK